MKQFLIHRWGNVKEKLGLSRPENTVARRPHLLDLKNGLGFLDKHFLDLPPLEKAPNLLYLRKKEHWRVPPSYRTGLVFFATVMLVAVMGIVSLDAQTLAESRRSYLDEQIAQNFSRMTESLEVYGQASLFAQVDAEGEQGDPVDFSDLHNENLVMSSDASLVNKVSINSQTELVEMGLEMSKGYQFFNDFVDIWEAEDNSTTVEKLNWMHRSAEKALLTWEKVLQESQDLSFEKISAEQAESLSESLLLIADLSNFLQAYESGFDSLLSMLGEEEPQRILIFLQDPHEKRATGGSLSAGIELLLDEGEILKSEAFLTSDYDRELRVDLQPPENSGLSDVTERWAMSTANAFLDTAKSAQQVHWFWQREARSSVDLIIFVNSTAFERLLGADGALAPLLPEKAAELNNFALNWSARNYQGRESELKEILGNLIGDFQELLRSPEHMLRSWPVIRELAEEKQIMIMSMDAKVQRNLESFGLSSPLPSPENQEDLLMVTSVNMGRNGTDRLVDDSYTLHTSVKEDGAIKHWLKIARVYNAESSGAVYEKLDVSVSWPVMTQLNSAENRSLIKVFVPKGSQITELENLDMAQLSIEETDSYTVWSFENRVSPGQIAELGFYYELPWKFDTSSVDNYRLQILKQAGVKNAAFEHQIKLPALFSIFQQLPEEPIVELDGDLSVAVVAGRNP